MGGGVWIRYDFLPVLEDCNTATPPINTDTF